MQGGRLKPDEKQSAKPRFGQARWRFADGRALLLTEAGTERKAGVWVVAGDPEEQAPLDGLGPDADTVDAATLRRAPRRSTRCASTASSATSTSLAGLGRRLANEICHRAHLSPFANTAKLDDDDVDALVEAIQVLHRRGPGLRAGPRRDELVGRPPGERPPPRRRGLPGVRRHRPRGRVHPLHGRLLPHLPDRRQGPRRQHDQQVPQVGAWSDQAELLDGVALLDQLGGARVDAGAAEVVDVEALDDLVLAVLGGAREAAR